LETPFKNVQSFSERQKFRLENHLAYFFFFIALMFEGKKRKDFMKTTITVLAIIFCITIINSTAGRRALRVKAMVIGMIPAHGIPRTRFLAAVWVPVRRRFQNASSSRRKSLTLPKKLPILNFTTQP
jgi:hypothetical protein